MANENNVDGVHENVEEPIPEKVINSMSEWNKLLKEPNRSHISTLVLKEFGNDTNKSLSFSGDDFTNLKSLIVSNTSCGGIREITITRLLKLESVRIGDCCFNMLDKTSENASFKVTGCSKLKTITVGEYSFLKCSSIKVFDNPRLETITLGKGSFKKCNNFSFSGTLAIFH